MTNIEHTNTYFRPMVLDEHALDRGLVRRYCD